VGYNSVAEIRVYIHSFSHQNLSAKSREIRSYCCSRSSKVSDLDANRKRTHNFLLVINSNFGLMLYMFEILTQNLENSLYSPPHPCLMPRSSGTRQNFWLKLIPQNL